MRCGDFSRNHGRLAVTLLCFTLATSSLAQEAATESPNWEKAQREAVQATYETPKDADAWFRLAAAEEKLGNRSKAITAYTKVVELQPSTDLSKQSLERIRLLGEMAEEKAATPPPASQPPSAGASEVKSPPLAPTSPVTQAIVAEPEKGGFSIGFSPIYKPKVAKDLGNSFSTNYELGVRMSRHLLIALRVARGILPSLALSDGTRVLRPSHTLVGLSVQGEVPLTSPTFLFNSVQLVLPVGFISAMNIISARGTPYVSLAGDFFAGIGPRINVTPSIFFDLAPLYHYSVSLIGLQASPGEDLKTSTGETIDGSSTGFELRFSVSFLL